MEKKIRIQFWFEKARELPYFLKIEMMTFQDKFCSIYNVFSQSIWFWHSKEYTGRRRTFYFNSARVNTYPWTGKGGIFQCHIWQQQILTPLITS